MTANEFRALALGFPGAIESAHMNHPDFRVGNKVFASLGYPTEEWAMVALTPDEQALVCGAEPDVFAPVKGGWGRGGATQVHLKRARKRSVKRALEAAWRRRAPAAKDGAGTKSPARTAAPRRTRS